MDKNKAELFEQQRVRLSTPTRSLPTNVVSNTFAGLSVIGLVADNSACGYYRVINPLHLLGMHGASVYYSTRHSPDKMYQYDIIIAPRQHNPDIYELLRRAVWDGKKVIYEIDDDLDSVLPTSPAYLTYYPGSRELEMIPKFIRNSYGLTTTTPEIARWYYRHNVNVRVVENFIDYSLRDWGADVEFNVDGSPTIKLRQLTKPDNWQDKIVVMYSLGSTHQSDITLIGQAMKHLLEKNPKLHLALYCGVDVFFDFVEAYDLPRNQVELVLARHFLDHPTGLVGADISLAPLLPCQFNLAKSHLKFLEGGAVGSVPIGSHVGPYARLSKRHPGFFFTVGPGGNFENWVEAVQFFVDRPGLLEERKAAVRRLVADYYSMEANIHRWPQAWSSIIASAVEGYVGPPEKKLPKTAYVSFGAFAEDDPCPCGETDRTYGECCFPAWGVKR